MSNFIFALLLTLLLTLLSAPAFAEIPDAGILVTQRDGEWVVATTKEHRKVLKSIERQLRKEYSAFEQCSSESMARCICGELRVKGYRVDWALDIHTEDTYNVRVNLP